LPSDLSGQDLSRLSTGRWAAAVALLIVLVAASLWALSAPRPLFALDDPRLREAGDAARGRLVYFAAGCDSCHASPGQDNPLLLGGGLELKTAFGSFFAPNISPDPDAGIGLWSNADLANAVMGGVSPQDEHLYPALPYMAYQNMTIADVIDLRAFLRTLPTATTRAPAHKLDFPFTIRRGIGLWKLLFLGEGKQPPDPARDAQWNRGRYLVAGPGHCAECHSPRNFMGAIEAGKRLSGGPSPDGKGRAPTITAKGLSKWSQSDLADFLGSGLTQDGDVVGGPMAEVVKNLEQLPESDRVAIAHYLLTP
jgi:mono/diheme cytochrome c family protein